MRVHKLLFSGIFLALTGCSASPPDPSDCLDTMLDVQRASYAYETALEQAKKPLAARLEEAVKAKDALGWGSSQEERARAEAAVEAAEQPLEPYVAELAYLENISNTSTPFRMVAKLRRHGSPTNVGAAAQRQAFNESVEKMWGACSSLEFRYFHPKSD